MKASRLISHLENGGELCRGGYDEDKCRFNWVSLISGKCDTEHMLMHPEAYYLVEPAKSLKLYAWMVDGKLQLVTANYYTESDECYRLPYADEEYEL